MYCTSIHGSDYLILIYFYYLFSAITSNRNSKKIGNAKVHQYHQHPEKGHLLIPYLY